MQKSQETLLKEQFPELITAEEAQNKGTYSNPKHIFEQIPYTPFWVTGNTETGYFAVMGIHKITENKPTINDVVEYVNSQPWEMIITLINIIISYRNNEIPTQTESSELNKS